MSGKGRPGKEAGRNRDGELGGIIVSNEEGESVYRQRTDQPCCLQSGGPSLSLSPG